MKRKKLIPLFALSVAAVPLAVVSSFRDNDHHRIIWQDSSLSYYNNNNYNINDYDFSTWMSEINDNKSFFDLSIPGSHDSGMWDGSGIAWAFGSRHARTQSLNIPNQLKAGIRAFDIRLDSEMWLRHGDTYSTLRFWDWMNQIVDFLKAHPREFVVARIKDEGFNVHDRGLAKHASELYEGQLNLHSSHIFNHWGRYKDDLDWRVKNLRGKLIIINNWHHKVNEMRRGGALYDDIITRTYSLQDQYQQRNTKTKARLVHEHMERSNSAPIRDKQLFVNFTSISSAGALGSDPSGFAGDMNWRVNDNVKNRPDLTKLGIVFMDFPGASLIQTIFKTNYYLKDEELALGYHKPLATNVTVDRISNSSNQVTINGNNLADLRIEIRYKGNTVQKVIVPGDVKNSYTFNFTGGIFEVDDSYTFQFYKEYPASYFYSSKRYNQFEITQQAHDDAFYENVNALKSRIESLMETYNGKSYEVKNYLNSYFLNKIKSLTVSNATNKEKLNLLRGQFIQYQSVFNDIRTVITEFQTVNDELQRLADELNAFIKSDIRNEFNQFLNNLNQYLRTVLIDSVNIDQIRLNDIWDNIRSKKQIMSNIIIYLKAFKTVNVSQLLSELKSKATELGVDHDYINNVDEPTKLIILNASNQLMRSEETYTEPHLNSFKQKLEREKNKYQITLAKIRTIKTKLNTLQLTTQEVSLFASRINNIVREENSNPEALTNDLQEYQNLITEGIALISADEEFQSDNYFDNITDLKTSYLDKIANLKTYISLRTTEPVDKLTYSDVIPEIKRIKEQIKEKTRVQKEFVNKINALEKIFPRQKEHFNNLVKSDDNVGTQIFDNAEALNERDYVGKFALLADLNKAQHNRYIDEIGEIVDYEEIETIYNKYIILNRKMAELKELINDLSDYDSLDSFGSLTQEEQRAFISIYDAARETFEGDSEIPAVINAIENLEKYFYLKDAELNNKINTLRQQINSDKKLYIFQKNKLLTKLKRVRNNDQFDAVQSDYDSIMSNYLYDQDWSFFSSLADVKIDHIMNSLKTFTNEDEYNARKAHYYAVKAALDQALNVKANNEDYKNARYYVRNNEAAKRKLDQTFNELKQVIEDDTLSITVINEKRENFLNAIREAEESSLEFIHDEELRAAIAEYSQRKNNVLERIHRERITNTFPLKKQFLDETNKKVAASESIALAANARLEDIKAQIKVIKDIADGFDGEIRKIDDQINKDLEIQRKLEEYVKLIYYTTEDKTKLASQYTQNELTLVNNTPADVFNLRITPNDRKGRMLLEFTVSYEGFSRRNRQIIEGFKLNEDGAREQLESLKAQFRKLKTKAEQKLSYVNDLGFKPVYDKLNKSLVKADAIFNREFLVYSDGLNAFNELNETYNNIDDLINEEKNNLIIELQKLKINSREERRKIIQGLPNTNILTNELNSITNFIDEIDVNNIDDLSKSYKRASQKFNTLHGTLTETLTTFLKQEISKSSATLRNYGVIPSTIKANEVVFSHNNALNISNIVLTPNDLGLTLTVSARFNLFDLYEDKTFYISGFRFDKSDLDQLKAKYDENALKIREKLVDLIEHHQEFVKEKLSIISALDKDMTTENITIYKNSLKALETIIKEISSLESSQSSNQNNSLANDFKLSLDIEDRENYWSTDISEQSLSYDSENYNVISINLIPNLEEGRLLVEVKIDIDNQTVNKHFEFFGFRSRDTLQSKLNNILNEINELSKNIQKVSDEEKEFINNFKESVNASKNDSNILLLQDKVERAYPTQMEKLYEYFKDKDINNWNLLWSLLGIPVLGALVGIFIKFKWFKK